MLSLPSFSSPIGGLHIRYDSSGSLPGMGLLGAGGGGVDTLPPVATSIEQLLERQWNEGQNFLLQQGAQGDGKRTHMGLGVVRNNISYFDMINILL